MKRTILFALLLAAAVLVAASSSYSQTNGIVSIGEVQGLIGGDTVLAGEPVRFLIKMQNNTTRRTDISNGYRLLIAEGGSWDSTTIDSIGPVDDGGTPADPSDDVNIWINNYFGIAAIYDPWNVDGVGADTVGFLGAGPNSGTANQLPTTWNDTVYAVTAWFSNTSEKGKHLCIDSSFFGTGGTWKWVGRGLVTVYPEWVGLPGQTHTANGYCFLMHDTNTAVTVDRDKNLPLTFSVAQNYPNPFNPSTTIEFEVPSKSKVSLMVYNVLGQKVATLVDKEMPAGRYKANWDGQADGGNQLSSGIYFYKFEAGNYVKTKKMVMLK